VQRLRHWPKAVLVGAAGVLAALGVATGLTQAAASSTTATTKKVTCSETIVATRAGGNNSETFGTVSCSAPFGEGARHDTSTFTTTSQTAGSFAGGLKLFFNTGTLRGRFTTTFEVAGATVAYDGTLKITSGTGEFAGVTGTGTIRGTSQDGVHSAITEKLTLKIPPKKST
jgi:hypothetical protein